MKSNLSHRVKQTVQILIYIYIYWTAIDQVGEIKIFGEMKENKSVLSGGSLGEAPCFVYCLGS